MVTCLFIEYNREYSDRWPSGCHISKSFYCYLNYISLSLSVKWYADMMSSYWNMGTKPTAQSFHFDCNYSQWNRNWNWNRRCQNRPISVINWTNNGCRAWSRWRQRIHSVMTLSMSCSHGRFQFLTYRHCRLLINPDFYTFIADILIIFLSVLTIYTDLYLNVGCLMNLIVPLELNLGDKSLIRIKMNGLQGTACFAKGTQVDARCAPHLTSLHPFKTPRVTL